MKKAIRILVSTVFALAMLSAVVGCRRSSTQTVVVPDAPVKDTIILTQAEEPTALITIDDDFIANQNKDVIVLNQIYDTLFNMENDGSYTPRLATGYTVSDDGLEYTVTLRNDVYFHNGEKMTAEDVAFTMNECKIQYLTGFVTAYITLDHVEVMDDYTVKFVCFAPFAPFISGLAGYRGFIINKSYYESVGGAQGYNRAPIGTGAYRFESRIAGESITLVANENYWDGAPAIKKITIKPIVNASTQFLSLENGEVDLVGRADLASCLQMNNPNLTWTQTTSAQRSIMQFTARDPSPFVDINLRRAVQYGLNKEEILLGANEGYGIPLDYDCVPTFTGAPDPKDVRTVPYDINKAKEYLAASTYKGQKLMLQCMVGTPEDRAAQIIQGQLMALGLNVEITSVDSATAIARRRTMQGLDLAISSHNSTNNDISVLGTVYKKSEIYTPFYSLDLLDRTDSLIKQGDEALDPAKRAAIYAEVVNIINDNALTIPLYSLPTTIAYNKGLKNVKLHFTGTLHVREWSW